MQAVDLESAGPVVLVAAHADDETIGAGILMTRLENLTVVHMTDSSPRDLQFARAQGIGTREEYARLRREELHSALAVAGVGPEAIRELGFVDQELCLCLVEAASKLASLFGELQPSVVLTHPYEGGHPDHDAVAFAVQAACSMLARPVHVIEFTSYHAGPGGIETGCFLDGAAQPVMRTILTPGQRRLKQEMLSCFGSQQQMLQIFSLDAECFRPAPLYNFSLPPHEGELNYERFGWGTTGSRWRELAAMAQRRLSVLS